ncbi:hypothetical protein ACWGSA_24565, partial [Streptomyces diastaticus]
MNTRRHARPLHVQQWRFLAVAAVLLVLSGAVVLVWLRIDAGDRRADDLAAASPRGPAGSVASSLSSSTRAKGAPAFATR